MANIMDEYVTFTKRCLNNYMKYILGSNYDKGIVNRYIDTYMEVRYSNYVDGVKEDSPISKKIDHGIDITKKELDSTIPDKKKDVIKYTADIIKEVYNLDSLYILESQNKVINNIDKMRKELLNIDDSNFIKYIDRMLKDDIKKKREYLEGFNSETFYLDKEKLNEDNNLIKVSVKDKIRFPELYSELAISKARVKSNINEDILSIGYILCARDVVEDLIAKKFDKKYFIDLPKSILEKSTKKNRLFSIIDNEFLVEHIILTINFDGFSKYRDDIIALMHEGYRFGLYLDDKFDYSSENLEYLEVFDYIFMNNDKYYYKDMLNNGKINKRIIIVDEVKE